MNTVQISTILNNTIGDGLLGVFPSDKLPRKVVGPAVLIVNTDPSNKPGGHWVAIYVRRDGIAEYFDSYGLPPQGKTISRFLKKFEGCYFSKQQIQGLFSSVCGHYCIFFAVRRWHNYSLEKILATFSENLEENDELITDWVNENFEVLTETYNIEFLVNQICHALKNSE